MMMMIVYENLIKSLQLFDFECAIANLNGHLIGVSPRSGVSNL